MSRALDPTVCAESDLADEAGQLAQFLPYQLSVASNAVSALIAERYRKRFALKIPEWRVMAVLGDVSGLGEGEGMTQRALTEATLIDKVKMAPDLSMRAAKT